MSKDKKSKLGPAKMQVKNKKLKGPSKKIMKVVNKARLRVSKASPKKKAKYLRTALSLAESEDISKLAKRIRRKASQASLEEREKLSRDFIKRIKNPKDRS